MGALKKIHHGRCNLQMTWCSVTVAVNIWKKRLEIGRENGSVGLEINRSKTVIWMTKYNLDEKETLLRSRQFKYQGTTIHQEKNVVRRRSCVSLKHRANGAS